MLGVKQTSQPDRSTSEIVKVFGCRPMMVVAAHYGAGVRKPPREETAGGAGEGFASDAMGILGAGQSVGEER